MLKSPDEFVKKGQWVLSFFVKQRSPFLILFGVAASAALVVYGWDWWSAKQVEKAWQAYAEIGKLPETERLPKLKDFCAKFDKTRPMVLAAVQLGDHFFDERKKELIKEPKSPTDSNFNSALEWYERALSFKAILPIEKQLLYVDRGKTFELEQKYDEALVEFQKAADLGGEGRPLALLNIGHICELKNDSPKATEMYQKITVEFQNTEYAKLAKSYLRRLKSPLFNKKT